MTDDVTSLSADRIEYLEGLVRRAKPRPPFLPNSPAGRDAIVKAMVLAGLEQAQYLARLAIEETRLGVLEDKAIKNMVATEFVYNYVRDKASVGVIHEFPERGLVEVAEPVGLIFSITPVTNPTSTVLFKCIMAIKTRNAVIFGPIRKPGAVARKPYASCMRRQSGTVLPRECSPAWNRPPSRTTSSSCATRTSA
jgi:acetaldehyde dehydrogenase/alcohol dehydrogenase